MLEPRDNPDHEVPRHDVRQFIAEVNGEPFSSYRSLDEARRHPDSAVVLSGDYGGTIFLTAPVRLVRCPLSTLETLVSDLDAVTWMSGDLTIATIALERHPVGSGVLGGDGGGIVVQGVWTHPKRLPRRVRDQAAEVVIGKRSRIDVELLRAERERELERKREWRSRQLPRPRDLPWDFDVSAPAVPFD